MSDFTLGFDTSNYTTSVAAVSLKEKLVYSQKKLLSVKEGELGLRQSDAVFLHTKQMPYLIEDLFNNNIKIASTCASIRPRNAENSYMPCFLVGNTNASCVASSLGVPKFECSHQAGHIAAVLFGSDNLELLNTEFIALHLSGGTTEALLVTPNPETVIKEKLIAYSLDLKAGQAIDRVGKMLGLSFPAGKELDLLAQTGYYNNKIKISQKDGNISLSGLENKCKSLIETGTKNEDVAYFCFKYIVSSLDSMISKIENEYNLPLVFCGGVSSNSFIRSFFTQKYGAIFADPVYSTDNAVGVAVLGQILNR